VKTYVWNARNQLVEVREGSSTVLRFQYDATGRRITKELKSGAKVAYLYDGLNAVEEHSGDTVRRVFTGLGIDERFARDDAMGRTYYLPDTLGSTAALVDAHGQVVKAYAYGPYGEGADDGAEDPSQNPYRYTGRELDAPGLYYYRARYYSTDLRRFISEDPLGLGGEQLNFYAYVDGNPVNRVDPLGLCGSDGVGTAACKIVNDRMNTGEGCERAVEKFCEFGPQHTQCCALQKDACMFGNEEDQDKLMECQVDFVKCQATKPKKIPSPPSDFPKNGKLF